MIGLADACVCNNGLHVRSLVRVLQGRAMWGNFLALCRCTRSFGLSHHRAKVRAKLSLIPYIFLVFGVAAFVLNIFMVASRHSPFGYSPSAYGWIFLLAVIPQLIGHSMFNWLLKYLSATMVSVTTLVEPIGSAILAFFFLKETPAPAVIGGGFLILSGIYLTSKQSTKPDQTACCLIFRQQAA